VNEMKIIELNPKKHYLDLEIDGEVKRYGLLKTAVSYIKMFHLGYYTNPVFINLQTKEINENAWML
jgi:hypothetical protein